MSSCPLDIPPRIIMYEHSKSVDSLIQDEYIPSVQDAYFDDFVDVQQEIQSRESSPLCDFIKYEFSKIILHDCKLENIPRLSKYDLNITEQGLFSLLNNDWFICTQQQLSKHGHKKLAQMSNTYNQESNIVHFGNIDSLSREFVYHLLPGKINNDRIYSDTKSSILYNKTMIIYSLGHIFNHTFEKHEFKYDNKTIKYLDGLTTSYRKITPLLGNSTSNCYFRQRYQGVFDGYKIYIIEHTSITFLDDIYYIRIEMNTVTDGDLKTFIFIPLYCFR